VWLLIGFSSTPTQAIIVVLGAGLCFGAFWIAAVDYVSAAAPPGLSATAQTLFGAAFSGLGWSLGAVIGGYLWDSWGGQAVFFFAGSMPIVAALIFGLGSKEV
jgi:PPP family 3-phenylpropionic acid transporter